MLSLCHIIVVVVFYFLGTLEWHDTVCGQKICTICNVKSTPLFEMRGLCYGTSFDKHFSWTGEKTEHYYFQGFSNSIIEWKDDQKEWRLTLNQNKSIYGVCNETQGLYPFGTFNWHFFNDTCQVETPIYGSQSLHYPISFSGWYFQNKSVRSQMLVRKSCETQNTNQSKLCFSMHL